MAPLGEAALSDAVLAGQLLSSSCPHIVSFWSDVS